MKKEDHELTQAIAPMGEALIAFKVTEEFNKILESGEMTQDKCKQALIENANP